MRTPSASLLPVLLAAAVLTLCGCGSGNAPGANQAAAPGAIKKAATPANALSPYLVSAVADARNGPPLMDLKFEVAGRPDVGDPVDVDVVIVPTKDTVDRFSGTVLGDDGLEVVAGDVIAPADKPAAGTPVHHAVKVVAHHDGIFTLTVSLAVSAAGQPVTATYTLPIIAGNGLGDAGATAAGR